MKKVLNLVFILIISNVLFSIRITIGDTNQAAEKFIHVKNAPNLIDDSLSKSLYYHDEIVGYVYILKPTGYIIVSSDDEISPILAYSFVSPFSIPGDYSSTLQQIVSYDLSLRLKNLAMLPESIKIKHRAAWKNLLSGKERPPLEQWPPEGTTASGGWLKTTWTQSSPYNALCPMDLVTGNRSLAGCPAVAMGQILNYYGTTNGTTFNDTDDYHHSYSGNNYWIDNDASSYGFPAFPELNANLETMMHHYRYQEEITNTDKATLVYACGVASHQVYASAGSGTFSVNQALQAYQRFNFVSAQLLTEDIPELYMQISQNIKHAMPVHLAIESPDQQTGHNVVVDGYNTDEYFHLNFGWGGAYDGWYLLPTDLPFGLTMIEGAIVDIAPRQYVHVTPDTLEISSPIQVDHPYQFTIKSIDIYSDTTIDDILFNTSFADIDWEVQHEPFPKTLSWGDSTIICLIPHTSGNTTGSDYSTLLRIILENNAVDFTVHYQSPLSNTDNVHTAMPSLSLYQNFPNPCSRKTSFRYLTQKKGLQTLEIYNVLGELVCSHQFHISEPGYQEYRWDNRDLHGNSLPSGLYIYRISNSDSRMMGKMVIIK
ncbi:MAG TPA: C10 family peptidase [Candidatus Cloacimonadota bacterium]|nr:C10 family peptidase [Candidatus Cloacimonadota bacterium]